jgi:hypothetical protein
MNKLSIILPLLMIMTSCHGSGHKNSDNQEIKRYEVKSGIVKYVITISGNVMGSKIDGSGTESLFFKDWGAMELKDNQTSETTEVSLFGHKNTETTQTHTMYKLDDGISFSVDFDNKQIIVGRDMAMDMIKMMDPNADAGAVGKNMLESMGGEIIGSESILGYTCDLWKVPGGKQWIYKGVVLKSEIKVSGIKTVTLAQSADFNVNVADKHFELPNFPIQKQESLFGQEDFQMDNEDMEDMDADIEKLSKMSFKEWKKLALSDKDDEEIQNMSESELREMYDMMQKMIKMRKENKR